MTTRILSALVALPIVLLPFYLGGWYLSAFVWVGASYACYEWMRLTQTKNIILQTAMLSAIFALIWFGLERHIFSINEIALTIAAAGAGVILFIAGRKLPAMIGAFLYIILPCLILLILPTELIRTAEDVFQSANENITIGESRLFGFIFLLSIVVPVWLADIGALLFGKLIGGAKLAPSISPNKTWAGLGGAIVGANLLNVAALPFVFRDAEFLPLWMSWVVYASLIGIISQAGDLFMSSIKRQYNVKDTGALIPGHGGLLDRIDGLLMVLLFLPLLYLVLSPIS